jgi:thymidine phosphorylase
MVGNAVEVNESVAALAGMGPADLMEVTLEIGAELLVLSGRESMRDSARTRMQRAIDSGSGLEKLREMVAAQGGDLDAMRPVSPAHEIVGPRNGYVSAIDTEQLGRMITKLGGGRKQQGDVLDLSVGLEMLVRLGEMVERGQPLVRVFARQAAFAAVQRELLAAIAVSDNRVDPPLLIPQRIERAAVRVIFN